MKDKISYSEWMLYRNVCQWRWKLEYLDKLRYENKVYSIHFDFGTAVHLALENFKKKENRVSIENALKIFEKKLRWLYKKYSSLYDQEVKPKDFEKLVLSGKSILSRFDECGEIKDAEVLYNEYKIEEEIGRTDDVKIKFKGFVDLVIKTKDKRGKTILYVCDFKTCSWGWSREKREDRNLHYQILLYRHFICKKFNLDPKLVRTAFVLLKKTPPKDQSPIEWFPISAGPISVQRAIDEINKDITDIAARDKTGDFLKNRKSCIDTYGRRCPFYDTKFCTK